MSGYPAAQLLPVAVNIQTSLAASLATFTTLPVAPGVLDTKIGTYKTTLAAKNSGAYADTIAFSIARHDLENDLADDGNSVNIAAGGDAAIVALSGYPSYVTGAPTDNTPPGEPLNVVVRQGDVSGAAVARFTPQRQRSVTEAQMCTGDPNVEANWKVAGLFTGGKASFSGIVPGTVVWFRFRTVGLNGVMGAFSDPAKLMVT